MNETTAAIHASDTEAEMIADPDATNFENRLCTELWTSIFEQLVPSPDPTSNLRLTSFKDLIKPLLLVSRKFYEISVPIVYREFTLSPRLLTRTSPVSIRVGDNFRRHTRCVHINEELCWDEAVRELSECEVFQDLV